MEREVYLLHQTPSDLAKELIRHCPIEENDVLLEPFKGEGSFYNNFPASNPKLWAELEEGVDYTSITQPYDWVITNPPFRLETGTKRMNSFYFLLNYYLSRARKGVAFLGNDRCFSTLTPKRIQDMNNNGWYIQKIIVCSVKKWRGRYFFIIITKKENDFFNYLLHNY